MRRRRILRVYRIFFVFPVFQNPQISENLIFQFQFPPRASFLRVQLPLRASPLRPASSARASTVSSFLCVKFSLRVELPPRRASLSRRASSMRAALLPCPALPPVQLCLLLRFTFYQFFIWILSCGCWFGLLLVSGVIIGGLDYCWFGLL